MSTYLYLFRNDAPPSADADDGDTWGAFIAGLRRGGHFIGGGALGGGGTRRADAGDDTVSANIVGYMVISAADLDQAMALLHDCPIVRAGGSVEVRHVPAE